MNPCKPVFIIRDEITVDDAINTINRLSRQARIIQQAMTEMTSGKKQIRDYFEEINELAAQVESNLEQVVALADWLDSRKIQEVKP